MIDEDYNFMVEGEAESSNSMASGMSKDKDPSTELEDVENHGIAHRILAGSNNADRYRKAVVGQLLAELRKFFRSQTVLSMKGSCSLYR